jgi:tight adherence protein B
MIELRIITVLTGLALLFLLQSLFWGRRARRARRDDALQAQLRPLEFAAGALPLQGVDLDGGWLGRQRWVMALAPALLQAGIEGTAAGFVKRAAAGVLATMVFGGLVGYGPASGVGLGLLALIGLAAYVSARRRTRLSAFDAQLPQAISLMGLSLRAGQTLEGSIRLASAEAADPLGGELRRCYQEYELGRPIEQALLQLGQRFDASRALRTFLEAVLVLKQTGGNVGEVIDKISATLRAQAAYEARFRALTAEGRISGVILALMPLVVVSLVLVSGPDYFTPLLKTFLGRIFLGAAIALWVLGVYWMSRILRPKV